LVVLPIVAGPILLILYLEHGSRFAANAAGAATLGIIDKSLREVVEWCGGEITLRDATRIRRLVSDP
jgi:hypothetical protein